MTAPIFIVGCPRSGTTLLRDLLRAHPNLSFPGESHFIPAFYQAFGDPRNESEARSLATRILALFWVRNWGLSLTPDDFVDCRSYREVVSRLFEAWARSEGKSRWGDKTPQNLTEIPTLLEIFPDAKFVHIYRDGRDVALSWLLVGFGPGNVYTAAQMWRQQMVDATRQIETLPPDTCVEVGYEALLTDTRATMELVCASIGEPFCEEVLTPNRLSLGHKIAVSRPVAEHSQNRWKGVMSSNVSKWKTQMSQPNRQIFESVAGDLLETLGYETDGPFRRVFFPEVLFWKGHHWFHYFMHRIRLPNPRQRLFTFLRLLSAKVRGRFGSGTLDS